MDAYARHETSMSATTLLPAVGDHEKRDAAKIDEVSVNYEPVELKRSGWGVVADVLTALTPLLFLGLSCAAQILNHTNESVQGNRMQDALLLAPTIFPIVFAAICGRMLKSLSLYKSQKGLELRLLEHLAGSQSMFGALERFFVLRSFGWIGCAVTLIWFLSPVGGQAFLRLMSREEWYTYHPYEMSYLSPDFLHSGAVTTGITSQITFWNTLWSSSLIAPAETRESPMDLWGNVKVPYTRSLDEQLEGGGWVSTGSDLRYNNLIGIPVGPLVANAATNFVISSVTMNISCSSLERTWNGKFIAGLDEPLYSGFGGGTASDGSTTVPFQNNLAMKEGEAASFLYVTNASLWSFHWDPTVPMKTYYGSATGGTGLSVAACNFLPLALDMNVTCSGFQCEVSSVRKKPYMYGSIENLRSMIWAVSGGYFTGMGTSYGEFSATQTDLFIMDPGTVVSSKVTGHSAALWKVPLADFEYRFSQVFNTYFYATSSSAFPTGIDNITDQGGSPLEHLETVEGHMTRPAGQRYVTNRKWLGAAFTISLILEFLAIVNLWLRWMTHVPDHFGYISALTVTNPYCAEQNLHASAALSGLERSRKFGDVKFQLADIGNVEEAGAGKVAFLPLTPRNEGSPGDRKGLGARYRMIRYGNRYH